MKRLLCERAFLRRLKAAANCLRHRTSVREGQVEAKGILLLPPVTPGRKRFRSIAGDPEELGKILAEEILARAAKNSG